MVEARRQVTGPAVAPLPFGLLSAGVVTDDDDPHLAFGVEYETLACGTAHLSPQACVDGLIPPVGNYKVDEDTGVVWTQGTEFSVYALHTCLMPGGGIQDGERVSRAKLAIGEGRAVEEGFAITRLLAPVTADDPFPDITPVAGTAQPLADAIAIAEEWAGAAEGGAYATVPTFHAARSLGSMLTNKAGVGIEPANGRLETKQGSIVASGVGYLTASRAAIAGRTPAAGERWLFLTGTTTVRRGPVQVTPAIRQSTSNRFHIYANRAVAVTAECFRARILVQGTRPAAGL